MAAARSPPPTSPCAPNAPPNSATQPTGATGIPSSTAPTAARASPSSPRCRTTAPPPPWPASRCAPIAAREYHDPADRRFHAQPVCCPNCGPALRYRTGDGDVTEGEAALRHARQLLLDGGVLAVKGIGGYHLACDAADERAVAELRSRKRRGDKPFAVMVPDLATAHRIAVCRPGIGTSAVGSATAHRVDAAAARCAGRRRGRAAQPGCWRHAGLHPAACTTVRAAGRRAGTIGTGDDIRQPGW